MHEAACEAYAEARQRSGLNRMMAGLYLVVGTDATGMR